MMDGDFVKYLKLPEPKAPRIDAPMIINAGKSPE